MREVGQDLHTHISVANHMCSRIDRIFTSVPPWALLQMEVSPFMVNDPLSLHLAGISEYSPVGAICVGRNPTPKTQPPISKYVVADPSYKVILDDLLQVSRLDLLVVPLRLERYKVFMREAARLVRDRKATSTPHDPIVRASGFGAMARAAWRNDYCTATFLIENCSDAFKHPHIVNGEICVWHENDPGKCFSRSRPHAGRTCYTLGAGVYAQRF